MCEGGGGESAVKELCACEKVLLQLLEISKTIHESIFSDHHKDN